MPSFACRACPSTSILSFLSRTTVRTNEVQAASEDGLRIVVEGSDVIAVRALPDLKLVCGQSLAQDLEVGGPDHVVGRTAIHQDRLRHLVQMSLSNPPESRKRRRGFHRRSVVRKLGDA